MVGVRGGIRGRVIESGEAEFKVEDHPIHTHSDHSDHHDHHDHDEHYDSDIHEF